MSGRFAAGACAALLAGCATQAPPPEPVALQIIALNDLHGHLLPPEGGFNIPDPDNPGSHIAVQAGGVEHMATMVEALRARNPNTIMVGAGDLIGASPLLSSLFHDEPTIEALTEMDFALAAVGNHEFDEGPAELQRMQNGGCHPVDGCRGPREFAGAGFQYLAASTVDLETGQTVFPPYAVREFGGVPVAFIGLTLEGTPDVLPPASHAGLAFGDEVETVNALVPALQAQGIEAIVVLLHEGGEAGGAYDGCPSISGPIVDIVNGFDDAVDLVVTGHTHNAYLCRIDGRLVTSAGSYGRLLTRIDAVLDPASGDIVLADAENLIVTTADHPAAPALTALLSDYRALAEPLMFEVVGSVSGELSRSRDQSEESTLGDVVADAMLAAEPDAEIAIMNPGGLRADIAGGADGVVTYNDLFTVQPFNNTLVSLTLTGAQIDALLEEQFQDPDYYRILQVSQGFAFSWDDSRPYGDKVSDIMLDGAPLDPAAGYRLVTNDFLASGGDGFTVFEQARDPIPGLLDIEALRLYFAANSPVAPGPQDRITRLD